MGNTPVQLHSGLGQPLTLLWSSGFQVVHSHAKRDLFNVITYYVKSRTRIAEQASICVFVKHMHL